MAVYERVSASRGLLVMRERMNGGIDPKSGKTDGMRSVELRFKDSIENLLVRLYLDEKKNPEQIGKIFGVSEGTVRSWLTRFCIPLRSASEARQFVDHTRLRKVVRERTVRRQTEAFGGDMRGMLSRKHYTEYLTLPEISISTGFAQSTIVEYMKDNGMPDITPTQGWIRQHTKLGKVLGEVWADPALMKSLSAEEVAVLRRRHLDGMATLEEIGYELKVTRQAVKQLEDSAINKLTLAIKLKSST